MRSLLVLFMFSVLSPFVLQAAESLTVSFKLRSMYYDPTDVDANPNAWSGSVSNGVPSRDRYLAGKAIDPKLGSYYGWTDSSLQRYGSVSAVVWLERESDGKFIKTLGRWCGNSGYVATKSNPGKGFDIYVNPVRLVHGDLNGRAYDLSRWLGAYGHPIGTTGAGLTVNRAPYINNKEGFTPGQMGINPYDGEEADYDSVLGPTVGVKVTGQHYLEMDNPFTTAEDASILTTVQVIPTRSAANQPQAWDMQLVWDPSDNSGNPTSLAPGNYNIIIEAVEWAIAAEFNGAGGSDAASIAYFRPLDHFKTIGYSYDGSSWSLRAGQNTNDWHATDSMRREGDNTDSYSNPFTGNTLTRGVNEPAVIYDINVNYTPPAATAPTAQIDNPGSSLVVLQGTAVNFQGSGNDAEDGILNGSALTWRSSRDGNLGSGGNVNVNNLSVNVHTVTLTATDSANMTGIDTVQVTVHRPPTANISTSATTINSGSGIVLSGSGNDPDTGGLTGGALSWSSSRDGALGNGVSVHANSLSVGAHTITLTATDVHGVTATDTVTITVNALPTVRITAPAGNRNISAGSAITFTAAAADAESAPTLAWTSSRDGLLSSAVSFSTSSLSVGSHTITITATDSNGASAQDSVLVNVNALPVANITGPAHNTNVTTSDIVSFTGTGSDTEDGTLTGNSLQWSSNLSGNLGNGTSFAATLSAGSHTIALTVTDSAGATHIDSITINVSTPTNTLPVASITSPSNTQNINVGTHLNFLGTGTDAEDGNLTGASLQWSSNRDGNLGTGVAVNNVGLSAGAHVITLVVTDSDGGSASDTLVVNVNAAPVASIATSNQTIVTGTNITINGAANDAEDGALTGTALVWTSSIDGALGNGATIGTAALNAGVHTITLIATDSGGLSHQDSMTLTVDDAPVIAVTAPTNNSSYATGANINFAATASDTEDGASSANIVWSSNKDGTVGTGASLVSALSDNDHIITASITDSAGTTRTVTRNITVGGAPVASISSPVAAVYLDSDVISFVGSGMDVKDGSLTGASLQWTSSRDGSIGSGTGFSSAHLSNGNHIITLTVTDSDNQIDSASVNIHVHSKPVTSITAPAHNSVFDIGAAISFTATASDADDGGLNGASVQWSSNINGVLGNGLSRNVNSLSAGSHIITVTATDSQGATATDSISISVNAAPSLAVLAPLNNAVYTVGDTVVFNASAFDLEDGTLDNAISWSSDRDGVLGTGTGLNVNSLSAGAHLITATVSDARGQTATQNVNVNVFAAAGVNETLSISFKTTPNNGAYAPSVVASVWVETQSGTFLKTIGRWGDEYPGEMQDWTGAAGGVDVDGYMGATLANHVNTLTVTWNMNGNIHPDGIYKIHFESTEDNFGPVPSNRAIFDLNKNGVPQSGSANLGKFNITSWSYSGRPPQINGSLSDSTLSGLPYSYTIVATNAPSSYNATGLPTGLSIDTTTGVISGTPIGSGTYNINIQAINAAGSDSKTLALSLDATPIINSSLSASGEVNVPFSYFITATNVPTNFSATSLPPGLSINTATGEISGTPNANGSFVVGISATNSSGTDAESLSLNISLSGVPVVTSASSAVAEAGINFTYQITGSNNPTSFAATGLPSGLGVNTSTGLISGVLVSGDPLNPATVGITASNAGGNSPAHVLQLQLLYHPLAARDVTVRVRKNGSVAASDVTAEQNNSTVYSINATNAHDIIGIDGTQPMTITFPPGGSN